MGVKQCNVKDCESIMCDAYLDGYGYICDSCNNDLNAFIGMGVVLAKKNVTKQFFNQNHLNIGEDYV